MARCMTRKASARTGSWIWPRPRICPARTIGRTRRWPMPRASPCATIRARIASAICAFPGLAHRMEDVGRIGKVRFINDSKATNADAAERALVCFPDIFWIAGGKPKEGGIESLAPHLPAHPQSLSHRRSGEGFCAHARWQGAVRNLRHARRGGRGCLRRCARRGAAAPVVLLSPACASFDQFRDFEQRGDAFRALVAGSSRPSEGGVMTSRATVRALPPGGGRSIASRCSPCWR